MNKTSKVTAERIRVHFRSRFDPIQNLTPERLARQLDAFHAGRLREAALTWEAIEQRDDVIQSVASKRKMSAARNGWDVLCREDCRESQQQRVALEYFMNNLSATNALDENVRGGWPLLLRQMMDAVGKRYAVHEIVWAPQGKKQMSAQFRFCPLWFFENTSGRLRFLPAEHANEGEDLEENAWLVTSGPGIMEACSVAFVYKHVPLRDWLIYCERNGMPGVRGVTDALPGTEEWNDALEAVEAFGAEFKALMTRGTDIEAIDLGARGELPYPALVERMDRGIAVLWRGSDLSTISREGGVGASLQLEEPDLLAESDAMLLSDTLNQQVVRPLMEHLFGEEPRVRLQIRPGRHRSLERDLQIVRAAHDLGFEINERDFRERFGLAEVEGREFEERRLRRENSEKVK